MSWQSRIISKSALKRLGILAVLLLILIAIGWRAMLYTPGTSFAGAVTPGREDLSSELHRHVVALAEGIGERGTYKPEAYARARDYIVDQFRALGYEPKLQTFTARDVECANIEVTIPGTTKATEIFVIGAHYDTVQDSPGANDNTSGVAGVLALARMFKGSKPARTIRFVAFAEEEPPSFQTKTMGSMVYAKACKDRNENIVGMFSLETIGYYSDAPDSQRYPSPYDKVYPSVGNFIGFVANVQSGGLMRDAIDSFRKHCQFPSEGGAVPDMAPGIGWSDHWSFWQVGYSALMVTDTAPFRYRHYHNRGDTPDKLDFGKMAKVIEGLRCVIDDLTEATATASTRSITP